jgi:hypothetical protein
MPTLPIREWPLLLARCAFLMTLVIGVALWGGTQAGTQSTLEWALIAVGVLYMIGGAISTEKMHTSRWLLGLVIALAVLGWLSALNPASVFDIDGRVFIPISPKPKWPWGAVDSGMATDAMRRITGMLGALLMARDMGSHPHWRRAGLLLIAWCGAAEAAFGFAQRMNGDLGNYWGTQGANHLRDTVFGCFWYHGNAGAFLNLCWPVMAALTWQEFKRPASTAILQQVRRAVQFLALLAIVSAVWTNHSRAAQAVFLLQIVVALLMLVMTRAEGDTLVRGRLRTVLVPALVFVLAIAVMAVAFGLDKSLDKWTHFGNGGLAADGRWAVLQTCAKWFGEIPLLGYGPGTFTAVFIVKTTGMSDAPSGYWQFAHDDYLQTFLEWGWLGLALWLAMGLAVLFFVFKSAGRLGGRRQRVLSVAIAVAVLSVAVHATVDFPLQIFAIQLYIACLAGFGMGGAAPTQFPEETGLKQERRRHGQRNHGDQAGAP